MMDEMDADLVLCVIVLIIVLIIILIVWRTMKNVHRRITSLDRVGEFLILELIPLTFALLP